MTIVIPGQPVLEQTIDRSPFIIGRDPAAGLKLAFRWLSRRHLTIELRDQRWWVSSESKNPVRVDGEVLDGSRALRPGNRIDLGPISIVFDPAGVAALRDTTQTAAAEPLEGATIDFSLGDRHDRQLLGIPRRHLVLLGEASARLARAPEEEQVTLLAAEALLEAADARIAAVFGGEPPRLLASRGGEVGRLNPGLFARARQTEGALRIDPAGERGPLLIAATRPTLVLYAERGPGAPVFGENDAAFIAVLAQLVASGMDAARRNARGAAQHQQLALQIARQGGFGTLIGDSPKMIKLGQAISRVAPTDTTVLIHGETGAGKELVAREVHQRSSRAAGPFFALNCATLPENLIESELFGHRRGAFSGADRDRRGVFELAENGTVFLDEIGELPLAAQAKLLRVLETKEILPLGAESTRKTDFRLVAATHRDLGAESTAGRFRKDLYFRLNVFIIAIPSLRDRLEDLPLLVDHFLAHLPEARTKSLRSPTPAAIAALTAYRWPGNVRELSHAIERAAILADPDEAIDLLHLPEDILLAEPAEQEGPRPEPSAGSFRQRVETYERELLIRQLEKDGWNRTQAAKHLRISLRTFMDKLRRYQIREPD